jgi:hypothetical protein
MRRRRTLKANIVRRRSPFVVDLLPARRLSKPPLPLAARGARSLATGFPEPQLVVKVDKTTRSAGRLPGASRDGEQVVDRTSSSLETGGGPLYG